MVFKAWTDSEQLMKWWGPTEWPLAVSNLDLRVGGVWHYCLKQVDGPGESWGKATYIEIVPPERLVYRDAFSDADGNSLPPESTGTVTFEDRDGKTLTTISSLYDTKADRDSVVKMGVLGGMNDSLDRLAALIARS
jgi:uncharacterized protein YndB with AHSA1/START domain